MEKIEYSSIYLLVELKSFCVYFDDLDFTMRWQKSGTVYVEFSSLLVYQILINKSPIKVYQLCWPLNILSEYDFQILCILLLFVRKKIWILQF